MRRKRPIDVFESEKDHTKEHAYVKFRGREPVDVTGTRNSETSTNIDRGKISGLRKNDEPYSIIHEHPDKGDVDVPYALPDSEDLKNFLTWPEKYSIIIHKNAKTGKELGRTFLKKTSYTDKKINQLIEADSQKYRKKSLPGFKNSSIPHPSVIEQEAEELLDENASYVNFVELMDRVGLKYRFVPAKGYEFSKKELKYVPSRNSGIESKVIVFIGIMSFIFSLLSWSTNINGFIINSNILEINYSGIILFLIGIVLSIIYFRKIK